MNNLDKLDAYSQSFVKWIIKVLPEFSDYAEVKEEENYSFLSIVVPSPSDTEDNLWITTPGDEITVGFSGFHTHIGYNDTIEEDFKEAYELIVDIMNENLVVLEGKEDNEWCFSTLIRPQEIAAHIAENDCKQVIAVKSWKGNYNQEYTIGS